MSSSEPPRKRQRLDPNALVADKNDAEKKDGYDAGIFVDQSRVSDHICTICRCVFNEPASIGCDEGHVFCKQCLDDFFKDNDSKPCPLDQQMVHKRNISPNKYLARLINSLRVVCPLQYQQTAGCNDSSNGQAKVDCEWTGCLSDMRAHTREQCGLFVIHCQYCGVGKQRRYMIQHVNICDETPVPCPLHCSDLIKRKLVQSHVDVECGMQSVNCDDCKESVLRKDLKQHQAAECNERMSQCPYAHYGCTQMVKANELQAHVAHNEVKHLQLKVEHLENQINGLHGRKGRKLVFLLNENQNKKAYIYNMFVNEKQEMNVASFMDKNLARFCMGKNISFSNLRQIGFYSKHIDLYARNVLFGVSRKADKISALCMKTMTSKTFVSDSEPVVSDFTPIWTQRKGLLLVGGEDPNNLGIGKKCIHQIAFNGNTFTKSVLAQLPYFIDNASCLTVDEKLFICGGWWNRRGLTKCCVYDLNGTQALTTIKDMNHKHQCGGICEWKERGNRMIVAAGTEKFVEEFDCVKNMWMDLPTLNEKHAIYPVLLPSSNLLFCIGGVYGGDDNLGCVELYDSRDSANKWMFIDHVEKYFDLPKSKGAGFNCFLSV